jgi:hypothetical protein
LVLFFKKELLVFAYFFNFWMAWELPFFQKRPAGFFMTGGKCLERLDFWGGKAGVMPAFAGMTRFMW